jgi:hypothetical protein
MDVVVNNDKGERLYAFHYTFLVISCKNQRQQALCKQWCYNGVMVRDAVMLGRFFQVQLDRKAILLAVLGDESPNFQQVIVGHNAACGHQMGTPLTGKILRG